jgi:hypothetical protein
VRLAFLDSKEIVAALDSLSVHDKFKLKEVEKFLRGTDLSVAINAAAKRSRTTQFQIYPVKVCP